MKKISVLLLALTLLMACSTEEASHQERTRVQFLDSLGTTISAQQWWRTAVLIRVSVTTDAPAVLLLQSTGSSITRLYDYKEVRGSGMVYMTAPQGQGNTLNLVCTSNGKSTVKEITLSGKPEEVVSIEAPSQSRSLDITRGRFNAPPPSLCGNSIRGNAQYYQFTDEQIEDFYSMMDISKSNQDAKVLELNTNYELKSHGPFSITWVNGYEGAQDSRILGYYYHSPNTWDDIIYVDLSETHKWDYIDGLAKVQYQINHDDEIDGHVFKAGTWYDANFDLSDRYGATTCYNMDRVGDDAYNSQVVFMRYERNVSAMRGISFEINLPEGTHIGFYLRSDEVRAPEQWTLLKENNIIPYTTNQNDFKGTCFCAEFMNVEGNGRGKHRSFVKKYDQVIWMGMEDLLDGGDHDCNDVIFGVVSDLEIFMPEIVKPGIEEDNPNPGPDPGPDPGPGPNPDTEITPGTPFPWTIAYEDVNRDADFDFNDAVIRVIPDYENEQCCVTVLAAGSTSRMYLHYDGPDGDQNLGEVHQLLGARNYDTYINTKGVVANTPFMTVDCVPWPKGYTMANDAKRFYIEIQRGTCDDCTDVITLPSAPGEMPEALLVAGNWQWPMEGVHINGAYADFPGWSHDVTRTRFWEWYQVPQYNTYVTY